MSTPLCYQPGAEIIAQYFPDLSATQKEQYAALGQLYDTWNTRLNLISRKDLPNLYLRHVLHSLSIAKVISFASNSHVLDVGTGGGFPGIPLAIYFPHVQFHLVDAIAKKVHAVETIRQALALDNVTTTITRVENLAQTYDFVLGRAITQLPLFLKWTSNKIAKKSNNMLQNGVLYLKGDGPVPVSLPHHIYPLKKIFSEDFFGTKQLLYIPITK